jgi:glucose-1-phosphate thymidylyltransferase
MWGIIPAAGVGSRMQPLAFSKELLPVGSRNDGGRERPVAVSEYLVERMVAAGVDKICVVISPGKSDIIEYFGGAIGDTKLVYVVQPRPAGLCDAIFCALPFIPPDDSVVVGLPDTVWFPVDGLSALPAGGLSFLLFPVDEPQHFDAVVADDAGRVREIQVKSKHPDTHWIWGAFKSSRAILAELHALWCERARSDPYIGTLVNAYLKAGGTAFAARVGEAYVDVGTVHGYRRAIELLG